MGGDGGAGGEGGTPASKVITFELVNGEAPTELDEISTQFQAEFGASFVLEDGTFPRISEVGRPTTGFTPNDNPRSNQGIGSFFLTDDGEVPGPSRSPLIVTLDTPTRAASGQILDIDFGESFVVEARDEDGMVLETRTIRDGDFGTGERNAAVWAFERDSADVYSLRFAGTRDREGGFGLGFDNFNLSSSTIFGGDGTTCASECDVVLRCLEGTDEAACFAECNLLLIAAATASPECGAAFVDVFDCVGGLSCEDFLLWGEAQNQPPPTSYPCRDEDVAAAGVCSF
jgi:hypothetical protein